MANEYGELEQLVNDVTSLDTARMTLRWALERLNTIEKEKADLKKGLTLAEETAKKLQAKEATFIEAYTSRNKTLEEKEDFYTKLEATMSLLGEGKLDIQQLLKKEAKLDSLRKSLETEYEDKFAELDRNQRSIIERWNARLLEVESQYAGRLAEAQKKYDSLRAEVEAEHQGRLTELQASFRHKEKELSDRISFLEGNVRESEAKVENRRRELETEYMQKRKEADDNYRKLRAMMEADMQEKARSMDSDHAAQVSSLEASWQAERARLLEEQRVREEQFLAAQARIKEIENGLAVQQDEHHSELLKLISEKETAFRARLSDLENEKAAKEAHVRELSAALAKRAAGWEEEKTRITADFERRASEMEAALKEREAALENDYAAKKGEFLKSSFAGKEELEKEFEARMADERRGMDAERSRMGTERARLGDAIEAANGKIKELEGTLSSIREEHRSEMMARIAESEASFRAKLEAFETEKRSYNETINEMAEEMRRRDTAALEAKKGFEGEFERRVAIYEEKIAALTSKLEEAATAAARQVEAHRAELASYAAEAGASAQEHFDALRADYEERARSAEEKAAAEISANRSKFENLARKIKEESEAEVSSSRNDYENLARKAKEEAAAAIEAYRAEVQAGFSSERNIWTAEKERFERTLEDISGKFRDAQVEIVALNSSLRKAAEEATAREAAVTKDLLDAKAAFEKELPGRVKEAVLAQTAALVEAMEEMKAEKSDLSETILKKDAEISALREEAARTNAEVESRLLAEYADAIEVKRSEMAKAYETMKAALDEDHRQCRVAMEKETSLLTSRLNEENSAMKAALEKMSAAAASANAKAAELSEKLLAAEKVFHSDKLEMQKLYVKEIEETVASAVDAAVEVSEQKLRQATEEVSALRKANTELGDRLLALEKSAHDEKLAMQKEVVREMDTAVSEAVDAAVEEYAQRLKHSQDELARAQKESREEMRLMEEAFAGEKERLMEEMDRRDNYIEKSELKIQDLEHEMIKYRQTSSTELMRSISEQEARFRASAAEEKMRNEARIKQLEELVSAKEKLLAESDKFYRQKQLELDGMQASLNMRLSESNEDLFAKKQELGDKEKALNDLRLKLENEYSLKEAELEGMKTELARAIKEYRNRK